MSTPARELSPDDPRLTEVTLRTTFEHPTPSTPEELHFVSIGLASVAQRLADVDLSWNHYKVDDSDTWRKQKFSSMLRSDPKHAWLLSKYHELQYSPFREHIQSFGTRLDFRFHANSTVLYSDEHYRLRKLIQTIRAIIWHALPKSISKIGCVEDKHKRYNRTVKVLYSEPVDAALLARIQSALPPEVSITRHVFPKPEFDAEFRSWCHMDLSADWKDRAQFELLLHKFHQTEAHRFESWERSQFALDSKAKKSLNAKLPVTIEELLTVVLPSPDEMPKVYVPRSPKTGRLARFVSVTVDKVTRAEDIHPLEWFELPSLE